MSIRIKGLEALIKKLGHTASVGVLEKPMQRSVYRLQRRMQEYPSPPSGSQYVRTGSYGKRWTARVLRTGSGLTGKVGNNIGYGPWVGSKQFQARVHRGRWNTDDGVMRQEQGSIVADFQRSIHKALVEG